MGKNTWAARRLFHLHMHLFEFTLYDCIIFIII